MTQPVRLMGLINIIIIGDGKSHDDLMRLEADSTALIERLLTTCTSALFFEK